MSEKANILVVDDELGPRESLRMILKSKYNVYTAEDGNQALEMIDKVPVDLITLDLRMPERSGIDILKEVKKTNEDIEVIIITGYGTLDTITTANQYGVSDYISKPFNVPDVIAIVEKSLQNRQNSLGSRRFLEELGSISGNSKMERLQKIFEKCAPLINQIRTNGHFLAQEEGRAEQIDYVKFLKLISHILDSAPSLPAHSERVHDYVSLFFKENSFSPEEKEEIEIASYFHDIGKMGLNIDLLSQGKNTQNDNYLLWQQHPEKGVEILKPLHFSPNILAIILHHHESYNGQGFPSGMKGKDIPLGARMVRIANVYDSLLLTASHPEGRSSGKALEGINSYEEGQLDPELLKIFIKALPAQGGRS
jgi:response regulator RpfG family c-di-GMP phosphodiesterase